MSRPSWHGGFVIAITLVVFMLSGSLPLCAQSAAGELTGTIVDAETNAPISGARVVAQSPSGRYVTTTDARGVYAILGILPDTYAISFSRPDYSPASIAGVTILSGSVVRLAQQMRRSSPVIAKVRSRSVGSAYQPGMTTDTYTVTGAQMQLVQGKEFNADQTSLLRSIPSVTLDKSGTVSIRGGFAFEAAYEFEGIDYTTPTPNLQNTLQNVANFSLLNGVGGVQLIPGGGDATHGNTGTGLIELTAKHGTYPSFAHFDFETGSPAFNHQMGFEFGWADPKQRLSNYFGFLGIRHGYQYGYPGASANTLGTRGTNAATLGTQIDPNLVYFSPAFIGSNDYVDNLIYRFGHNQNQRFQLFFHGQAIKQDLDYGGFSQLQYISAGTGLAPFQGTCPLTPPVGSPDVPANSPAQNVFCRSIVPFYPGQPSASAYVTQPDRLYSPFTAYKLEYGNSSGRALLAARFYRAFAQQSQELPSQGVLAEPYGGVRTGAAVDISAQLGGKHLLKTGAKYEFARPFGDRLDVTSYTAFTNPQGILFPLQFPGQPVPFALQNTAPNYNPFVPNGLELDFLSAADCATLKIAGNCGYLSAYFPGGVRMPVERDVPTASQQLYGMYLQDDVTFSDRYKGEFGLRYDGFNFLIPSDSADPPGINAVRHQRQLEPHLGFTYILGKHDTIRAGYGHTLAVPLPGLIAANVDRRVYAAFAHIPSYDNTTGKPATYCGLAANTLCTSYGDQLYWLIRDYRFGAQPLNAALHGATFTNVDISWAHEFRDGAAIKLTPFYRRGYDVVEQTSEIVGINPDTGAPVFGNSRYSNLGQQKATGVEFLYTKNVPVGISIQAGATYINQLGNEPPGGFLTQAALDAGELYRSPDLAPFQATLALSYKNKDGFRVAPVVSFASGYPYGAGYYTAMYCNGKAVLVPSTDLNTSFTLTPNYVDPQNPGSCTAPNVAASRGNRESALPGGLQSSYRYNLDLTLEYAPPAKRYTVGLQFQNLTDRIYNVPVFNTCWGVPVVTGQSYGTSPCTFSTAVYGKPETARAAPFSYNVFPNQTPFSLRFYYQVKI